MRNPALVSVQQLTEIRHALGGKIEKGAYRNHFNTGIENESWEELVKMGFATKRDLKQLGGVTYFVTELAIDQLSK